MTSTISIERISVNGRHRRDLGDVASLANSIGTLGLLHPIVVSGNYELIAGERRLEAAKLLGWTEVPVTITTSINDALTLLIAERDENTCRKDFAPSEAVAVAAALEAIEKPKAEARRKESQGRPPKTGGKKTPVSKPQKTRDRVAAAVGMSGSTYEKAKSVVDAAKANPEKFAAVKEEMDRTGNVNAAVREIKREEVKAKLEDVSTRQAKAASGVYDVLVIDPPWPMEKIDRDCRPNQSEFDYPTMTEAELAGLKIPAAADAHVWVWTTQKFLPMALRLLEAWSLKYVCTFVWHKPGGFQPIGLPQFNCEFALYCRKGAPSFIDTKAFNTCFDAPRGKHSEKPGEFYDVVRRVTAGRRLDMFNRREIDGFDGWGKEAHE